ncbi:hypothetical protein LBMAG52_09140 [Planctomycetia bacterium]|nr:hypothetical protein LBMAG52_09140 [Planctomycetia bacterium]
MIDRIRDGWLHAGIASHRRAHSHALRSSTGVAVSLFVKGNYSFVKDNQMRKDTTNYHSAKVFRKKEIDCEISEGKPKSARGRGRFVTTGGAKIGHASERERKWTLSVVTSKDDR